MDSYTPEQYAIMERLESGLLYQDLNDREQEIVRYLDDAYLAQPRAYIQDGYYELSQEGCRVLNAHRQELFRIQEEERRQQEQLEESRLAADRKARDEAAQREEDKKFQTRLSILSATYSQFLAFLSGALLTNLDRLIPLLIRIIKSIVH